ncbi:hypothetical protein LJR029_005623 [Caballeronia sp. LjRoot29]|uniref:hypothetical protein n=1 Tax=Caballeronia sp. LjRoot29 TaxID=3342315 RepID=UPI003ED17507
MKNNRPLEIILGGSVDMEAQSHGLSVAAIRNAQGKKNPGDFPVDSTEWHRVCEEFVSDVYVTLGGDPNDMWDDSAFFELGYESEEGYQQALDEELRHQT